MNKVRQFASVPALAISVLLLLLFVTSLPAAGSPNAGAKIEAPTFVIPSQEVKPQQKLERDRPGFEIPLRRILSFPDIASRACYTSECLHVNAFCRNVFYVLSSINAP